MASSLTCTTTRLAFTTNPYAYSSSSSSFSLPKHSSKFLGLKINIGCSSLVSRIRGPSNRLKITCWFKFGKNGVDAQNAGIYGSQSRNDFDRDDVEQYFNYMGMLAVEGSYDKMDDLLNQDIHPVDILLMLAATEGDKPKIEELLRAGANYRVKDADGRTALDRANDEIRDFILGFSAQKA